MIHLSRPRARMAAAQARAAEIRQIGVDDLGTLIAAIGNPDALTLEMLRRAPVETPSELRSWFCDRRNRRSFARRLVACGYVPVRNPDRGIGLWEVDGQPVTIYCKAALGLPQQLAAVHELMRAKE
jgi:hypothetical protein